MNSLEALLRLERTHGRRDPTESWYVEVWLAGEGSDGDGRVFEALQHTRRRLEGVGAGHRHASRPGREEKPC
jgi:hypothetical protein